MLKFMVVLSLLSITYAEDVGRPTIHLTPQVFKAMKDAATDCVKETEVNQEISDNFFDIKFSNDTDTKKFIYCLCRKFNYADEDGHLNDSVLTLFEGSELKDDVQKVIADCNNKIKKNDKLGTMFQVFMCVYKNSPVLLGV